MPQRPIEACGVIGDLHTVALVAMDGTIDWCCLPRFDSASIFAAILDEEKGGYFRLAPDERGTNRQMYMPETNVLLTRFLRKEGVGEVVDFMPVRDDRYARSRSVMHEIIRIARAVRGAVRFRLVCVPAFDYARRDHQVTRIKNGVLFTSGSERVVLLGPVDWQIEDGKAVGSFTLQPGETAEFTLRYLTQEGDSEIDTPIEGQRLMEETVQFWRDWLERCTYKGRWREQVTRSALVLKLLTHRPSGAIVASPTCSLPEEIGGSRNWDYRFTWIRDAAFTVYSLVRLGFTEEATAFFEWLQLRVKEEEHVNGPLNVLYGIDGRHNLAEVELDHLSGYKNSRPVRIGNRAYHQLQLDIYGELMDSIYLYDKHVTPISYDLWQRLQQMLHWVADNWHLQDEGIWEVRSHRQNFVYSKLQCWVALDRGIRLAEHRSFPLDRVRLKTERDRIFQSIMQNGWDAENQCFTQSYESKVLDAANLLMPLLHFIAPRDPRMLSTLNKTMDKLVSDSLV
ncbi:MAG TPA: glycoside hydrolase family 15 protein, partial [Acidobacteriaceae bacterium]|nr:glycoside hydrolase family 15 protein [Acidobacteriaceae bacterium]